MAVPSTEFMMDALVEATNELAAGTLGLADGVVIAKGNTLLPVALGSCVALLGTEEVLQLGFCASARDAMSLGRALFAMSPDDGDLSEQDLVDAPGEVANLRAGGVKRRMAATAPDLRIGLPLVIGGTSSCRARRGSRRV